MVNVPQYCMHWMSASPSVLPVGGHFSILNYLDKKVLINIEFVTSENAIIFHPLFPSSSLLSFLFFLLVQLLKFAFYL